jgi:hypothetical protein
MPLRTFAVAVACATIVLAAGCAPSSSLIAGRLGFADAGPASLVRPQVLRVARGDEPGVLVIAGRHFGASAPESRVMIGSDADGRGGAAAEIRSWRSDRIEIALRSGTQPGWLVVWVGATASNAIPFDVR